VEYTNLKVYDIDEVMLKKVNQNYMKIESATFVKQSLFANLNIIMR